MTSNKKHWLTLASKEIFSSGFFKFRCDTLELPDGRVMPRYYVLDFPDWVNVVTVTKEKKVVMIRQFRPPVNAVTLEVPGGSLDPKSSESPEEAGKRELLEETGFKAGSFKLLGYLFPNPALMSNKLWVYLATDCEKVALQNLDQFEDIEVCEMSITEVMAASRDGSLGHALVTAALHLAEPDLLRLASES